MFDHANLIILLLAPVVAYLAGALLFTLYAYVKKAQEMALNSPINNGHSL